MKSKPKYFIRDLLGITDEGEITGLAADLFENDELPVSKAISYIGDRWK